MRITFETRNGLCIMHFEGRFVTGSDTDYRRTKKELESRGFRKVVADCRQLPYLDSTGLTFMVGLHKMLRDAEGFFVLADINHRVREVLRITRLDMFLPVFESVPDAIDTLESRRGATSDALRPLLLTA